MPDGQRPGTIHTVLMLMSLVKLLSFPPKQLQKLVVKNISLQSLYPVTASYKIICGDGQLGSYSCAPGHRNRSKPTAPDP